MLTLIRHGSRATNYGGILGQGLRIAPPEAPSTGFMFDRGIYLADMSSKSANYCVPSISGGQALLLLCEAELGNPMQELTDAKYDAGMTAAQQGMIATWGKGMTAPSGLKDAGVLHPSLSGVQMVLHPHRLNMILSLTIIPARYDSEAWQHQRQRRVPAVQRVHLLQRRAGAVTLFAPDFHEIGIPTPA